MTLPQLFGNLRPSSGDIAQHPGAKQKTPAQGGAVLILSEQRCGGIRHRHGVAPADCIVFEDAPFGIEAARRAGMRAVAICTTHKPEELAGPHVIATARDFEELMKNDFLESLHA